MKQYMHSHLDESAGAITGMTVWVLTHIWHFPLLQVQAHPIASEVAISAIRMFFGIGTAVGAYFIIHFCKKHITHEIKPTKRKHHEN